MYILFNVHPTKSIGHARKFRILDELETIFACEESDDKIS